MHKKSCGNGSKNCVVFRNAMRNGIAIGNPSSNRPTFLRVSVPLQDGYILGALLIHFSVGEDRASPFHSNLSENLESSAGS